MELETAYRLAVARVRMTRDASLNVDAGGVRDAAEAAVAALKEVQKVRNALTGAETRIDTAREGIDAMVDQVRKQLERIETLIAAAEPE